MNHQVLSGVRSLRCCLIAGARVSHTAVAGAGQPPIWPILRTETGSHLALSTAGRWPAANTGGTGGVERAALESLRRAAGRNHNGTIELGALTDYIEGTVPIAAKRKSHCARLLFRDIWTASFPVLPTPQP
jgi:hypothetical protein